MNRQSAPVASEPAAVRGPESPAPARRSRLFTADEVPMPPPEMRRPPGEESETLFDMVDGDESDAE